MIHGDPVISGAGDSIPDRPDSYKGPRCGYTVERTKDANGREVKKSCDSPEVVWDVNGRNIYGAPKKTPVCGDHIEKAWKEWGKIDYAEKIKP